MIPSSVILRDELEASRCVEVDPHLNEKYQDDLLYAGQSFEIVENVAESARGRDERHIEDDVDEEYKELQNVEYPKEDASVVEDPLIFTKFAEHSNINIKKSNNQKKDGQIIMYPRQQHKNKQRDNEITIHDKILIHKNRHPMPCTLVTTEIDLNLILLINIQLLQDTLILLV